MSEDEFNDKFGVVAYILITTNKETAFTVASKAVTLVWPQEMENLGEIPPENDDDQEDDQGKEKLVEPYEGNSYTDTQLVEEVEAFVRWAGVCTGAHDVIVIARAKSMQAMAHLVVERIQNIPDVKNSTTTTNAIGKVYGGPNASSGHP
jgi:DNA-binding Lrp family transcriptional regulator